MASGIYASSVMIFLVDGQVISNRITAMLSLSTNPIEVKRALVFFALFLRCILFTWIEKMRKDKSNEHFKDYFIVFWSCLMLYATCCLLFLFTSDHAHPLYLSCLLVMLLGLFNEIDVAAIDNFAVLLYCVFSKYVENGVFESFTESHMVTHLGLLVILQTKQAQWIRSYL